MVVDRLDAAGALGRELPEHQRYGRRAFLATLCVAGPRFSELIDSPRGRLALHAGQLGYEDFEAASQGLILHGRGGFRTCDLSRVKREERDDGQPPEQGRLF